MEKSTSENDIKTAMHLTDHKADEMAKKQKTYDFAADLIFNEAIDISLNKPFQTNNSCLIVNMLGVVAWQKESLKLGSSQKTYMNTPYLPSTQFMTARR